MEEVQGLLNEISFLKELVETQARKSGEQVFYQMEN